MGAIIKTRLKRSDIAQTVISLRGISKFTHRYLSSVVNDDYQKSYNMTREFTMVATGETRSKLFKRTRPAARGTKFVYGYGPTSNNQSVSQEFEDGPVHRREGSHWTKFGYPKCSRKPDDVFSKFGSVYISNPGARRRAMAVSVERVFKTEVRSAVKSGENFFYRPNFHNYSLTKRIHLAKAYKAIGIR